MNAKILITTLAANLTFLTGHAQNPEAADSLIQELHEIVVSAKQQIGRAHV